MSAIGRLPAEDGRPSHGADCCSLLPLSLLLLPLVLWRHRSEVPALWRDLGGGR